MKNKMNQKEIDQMVTTCSNLVKTNHNLNARLSAQAKHIKESRTILNKVRTKLADEGYLIDGPTIKRIDKYLVNTKK